MTQPTAALQEKLRSVRQHNEQRAAAARARLIEEQCAPLEAQCRWWEANKGRVVLTVGKVQFTLDELNTLMFAHADINGDQDLAVTWPTVSRFFEVDTEDLDAEVEHEGTWAAYQSVMEEGGVLVTTMASNADIGLAVAPPAVLRRLLESQIKEDPRLARWEDVFRRAIATIMDLRHISAAA